MIKNIWDITNSISNKVYLEESEEFNKLYNQYVINLFFSMFPDTIAIVNEVNGMKNLSNRMHYDFLFYFIRKNKRYGYQKKTKGEDLNYIAEAYSVGKTEAEEIDKLLTEEQKEIIKNLKGGKYA